MKAKINNLTFYIFTLLIGLLAILSSIDNLTMAIKHTANVALCITKFNINGLLLAYLAYTIIRHKANKFQPRSLLNSMAILAILLLVEPILAEAAAITSYLVEANSGYIESSIIIASAIILSIYSLVIILLRTIRLVAKRNMVVILIILLIPILIINALTSLSYLLTIFKIITIILGLLAMLINTLTITSAKEGLK